MAILVRNNGGSEIPRGLLILEWLTNQPWGVSGNTYGWNNFSKETRLNRTTRAYQNHMSYRQSSQAQVELNSSNYCTSGGSWTLMTQYKS